MLKGPYVTAKHGLIGLAKSTADVLHGRGEGITTGRDAQPGSLGQLTRLPAASFRQNNDAVLRR
jgi:NAD(P)-dependent dehydrogenase (short-subunit alcohol dehydrogenase family)